MRQEFVLLITGCIRPNVSQPFLMISDAKIRYEQYISSIIFYLEHTMANKVVFCENSNFMEFEYEKLLHFAKEKNKEFEWLTFQGNDKCIETKGKGYGEGEIIEYALHKSVLLQETDCFAKVTGRLKIKNFDEIMQKIKMQNNYFNADLFSKRGIDTRFYFCQKEFYKKHLQDLYLKCDDYNKVSLERLFYITLIRNTAICNLPYYPVFVGVSAGNGNVYSEKMTIKFRIADALCRCNIFNFIYLISGIIHYIEKGILILIPRNIKYWLKKRIWRKRNKHNFTKMASDFALSMVKVGKNSYGSLNVLSFIQRSYLTIGDFVSIAPNVWFLLDVEHFTNHISTYPFKVRILEIEKAEAFSKGNIVVDDDVWIGFGAVIMSGVHIGQGAIIAAGALVNKDVPPYAIVGGVPARIIKYRFEEEMVKMLTNVDWGGVKNDMIEMHLEELYATLENSKQLNWLPRR